MKLDEILRRRIDRHHLGSAKAGDVVAAARLADRLRPVGDEGFLPVDAPDAGGGDTVLLLPAFDPYVVGSLRRLETVSSGPKSAVSRPQGWISPTLVVNGRIEGVWELADGHPVVTPFAPLSAATRRALPEGSVIR